MDKLLENLKQGKFTEDFSITHIEGASGELSEAEKKSEELPTSIMVTVEAIHAGMTKNKTFYPADKLEASVHTWLTPFNKPVIKNHDTWEEPNGRVMDAYFKDSILKPETKTIELKLKISDPDVIKKVLDGRYQTLSIGGSTNEARCSICAKNLVEAGWCGHSKGRKYDGKEAYWIIGDMEFNEISWVNVPADVNARVVSIDKETSAGGRKESVDGTNLIDDILNEGAEDTPETPIAEGAEQTPGTPETPADPATQTEGDETPEGQVQTQESEKTDAEKLQDALDKITELEGNITTLTTEKDALISDKKTLQDSNTELETQITEKDAEIQILTEERDGFRNKSITLAKTAHRIMAESAVNLRVVLGEATAEERESLISEYAKTPAKVLESTITDLVAKKPAVQESRQESTKINVTDAVNGAESRANGEEADGITESAGGTPEQPTQVDIEELASRMIGVIANAGRF